MTAAAPGERCRGGTIGGRVIDPVVRRGSAPALPPAALILETMFRLTRPTDKQIVAFLATQREGTLSYGEIGATRGAPPPGYVVDHNRVRLGVGRSTFDRAVTALRAWRMSSLGWTIVRPVGAPTLGTDVAVVVRHFGFWSLNACRVLHQVDEESDASGFVASDSRMERFPPTGKSARSGSRSSGSRGRERVVRPLRGVATRTPARPPGLPARAATAASVRPRLHASDDRRDVGSRVRGRAVTG